MGRLLRPDPYSVTGQFAGYTDRVRVGSIGCLRRITRHENILANKVRDAAVGHSGLVRQNVSAELRATLDIDPAFKIVSGEGFDRKDLSGYSLVVTDYSLLSFDFAYLRRPVIYCRFDAEKLKPGEKKTDPSYFDYEEDGFGPVCGVPDEAAERIIECMDRDCALTVGCTGL